MHTSSGEGCYASLARDNMMLFLKLRITSLLYPATWNMWLECTLITSVPNVIRSYERIPVRLDTSLRITALAPNETLESQFGEESPGNTTIAPESHAIYLV